MSEDDKFRACRRLPTKAIEHYFPKSEVLGKGGYGEVYRSVPSSQAYIYIGDKLPEEVAVKKIQFVGHTDPNIIGLLESEINNLRVITSKNLPHTIKFYGCFSDGEHLYFITDIAKGKELYVLLKEGTLTIELKIAIAYELAVALYEFSSNNLVHRDMKLENVMVDIRDDNSIELKILDYGFLCSNLDSAKVDLTCTLNSGTLGYHDRKIQIGNLKSMIAADWWAYGQILYMIFTGTPLYDKTNNRYLNIENTEELPEDVPEAITYMLIGLTNTQVKQSERPDPASILAIMQEVYETSTY